MNKLTLVSAIATSLLGGSIAFAAPVMYDGIARSGTAAAPMASFQVEGSGSPSVWYVNSTSPASNTASPAVQLNVASDWSFDFSNLAAVSFTGNLVMGDYRTQTSIPAAPIGAIDSRQSYKEVLVGFSGVGSYDETTNTFTYNFMNNIVNGGGASTFQALSASCLNGATSILGKACTRFIQASPQWEGLALNFVFSENRAAFAGSLRGTDTSGSGLSLMTTTINWQVQSAPLVNFPVPGAAWLFGSGLVGLAGFLRRRRKT